mmetsp:Transcript_65724/g.171076  ORF Transcript_65724/g.171076 Transcript_65724/m.171076 type:complete len:924 (-) Transcript_65724:276-3047(-)
MPGSRSMARGKEALVHDDWSSDDSDGPRSSGSLSPGSREASQEAPCVARAIYKLRWVFLLGWPALTVALAPCAYLLLLNAQPMTKKAPEGTESTAAMQIFEQHFPDLAEVRREMVVLRCRTHCKSAATDMSRGIVEQISDLLYRFQNSNPDAGIVVNSYFTFSEHHQLGENPMISADRQSILLLWVWRVPERLKKVSEEFVTTMQVAIDEMNDMQPSHGLSISLTGLMTLDVALQETLIEEIPVHELSTIWLPFCILAYALRSPRMLLLAMIPMPIEILISFGLVYFASLKTVVLFYALMMMLMMCTSLSFDYALFMLTRYAEERAAGEPVDRAIVTVISQGGRVVVVSGIVLIIAWGSMAGLPVPFNTFSLSSCTMIAVCVLVQLTFVPSLLAIMPFLGPPAAKRRGASLDAGGGHGNGHGSAEEHSAFTKAQPHMQGIGFWLGRYLTAFPLNIIVPIIIYTAMMPLTLRMSKNFEIDGMFSFKFKMGHSFALGIPRSREEWSTALEIQDSFPSSVGIMMPMLIIGTGPSEPDSSRQVITDGSTPIDVKSEKFFHANCQMANALIEATSGKPYALGADSFVSGTFHGEADDGDAVKCLSPRLINAVRTNYITKHWLLRKTSANLQQLWDQIVSGNGDAMLTFVFPVTDPFSPDAFSLVDDVRSTLRNQNLAAQDPQAPIPGLTFTMFSPGSVVMDLIDVTSRRLPQTFMACVVLSLLLIGFWFKAVLIPFKLLLTVVVPITWTYGAALYVYEDGVISWLGFPGLSPLEDFGIDWTVPLFTLTFIVGLAFDYEIFLIERVREFREEGFGDRESIQLGLAATGDTITSAGMIMALTFIAELLGSVPVTNQMGFILVFSIVVDTFVVRTILVPAMLSLAPAANFWPSRMPLARFTWLQGCRGQPELLPDAEESFVWEKEKALYDN